MSWWRKFKTSLGLGGHKEDIYSAGTTPLEKDTLTAIHDLSRAVMANPDAVEIYLALGNLYRSRGDLERAVQIRESLLIRPELPSTIKGKVYYELGQDYRRAGLLDRSFNAYVEAERLGVPSKTINNELAGIYSSSGNWEKAAEYYHALGNKPAEAHYLVRDGEETLRNNPEEQRKALRYFNRALKVYPASVEAWAALISHYAQAGKWPAAAKALSKALDSIPVEQSFMLFEEILGIKPKLSIQGKDEQPAADPNVKIIFNSALADALIPVLERRPPEFFPNYYGATILHRAERLEAAEQWLDRALVMRPDFWYGRLLHLDISRHSHVLPPVMDSDLEFFIKESSHLKRFMCSVCGLNRDQLFYVCPRCNSWHSATFKSSLTE